MSKLLQERWMRLAFAPDSTTVELNEAHPNSKIYDDCQDGYRKVPGKARGEKGSCVEESDDHHNGTHESDETLEESDEMFAGLEETDENFMGAIAAAAADGKDEVEIDGETFPVEMEDETVEAITGEKPKDSVDEAISRWYNLINEDGFDKEKKDKMKCNTPRRLRDGEPGHGEKSKVVKACDPGSDKEAIVKFGDPDMPVQAHHADNKASFHARHKCDEKSMDKDWNKAGYWACKDW